MECFVRAPDSTEGEKQMYNLWGKNLQVHVGLNVRTSPVTGALHSCTHPAPAAGSWPRPHTAALTALRDDTPGQTLQGPNGDNVKCRLKPNFEPLKLL